MTRSRDVILPLLAAFLVLIAASSAAASVRPRATGDNLVRLDVTIAPGEAYLARTAGCDGTTTDTVMYLIDDVSPGVVRTLAFGDDFVIDDPDTSNDPPTLCSQIVFTNPSSSAAVEATLLIASDGPGLGGVVDLIEMRSVSGVPTGTTTTTGLSVESARWTLPAWVGDDSQTACKSQIMTKPLRPGATPRIQDTVLYALNAYPGGLGYFDDDGGLSTFSSILPAETCVTGAFAGVFVQQCDVVAGAFTPGVDQGDVELWHNQRRTVGVFDVCTNDGDLDGVANDIEAYYGTNPDDRDSDKDGLTDYQELIGHPPDAARVVIDPPEPDDTFPIYSSYTRFAAPYTSPGFDDAEVLPLDDTNPLEQDVFLEVDYMAAGPGDVTDHRPYALLGPEMDTIFGDAGWTGRGQGTLHLAPLGSDARSSQMVPYKQLLTVGGCEDFFGDKFSAAADILFFKADPVYFNPIRNQIYHYAIAGNQQPAECDRPDPSGSSGLAELWGSNHIITLGPNGLRMPTPQQQLGTHVHELGHNLFLGHNDNGSNAGLNSCVHGSVMNYRYQMVGWDPWNLVARPNFQEFSYSRGRCDVVTAGFGCANTCVSGCVPQNQTSPKARCQSGLGNFPGCDCDADEWQFVNYDFQQWGPAVAGVAGEAEVLAYLSGKTSVAPPGLLEMQQRKLEAIVAAGFVEGIDFEVGSRGDLRTIESGPLSAFTLGDVALFGSEKVELRDRVELLTLSAARGSAAAGPLGVTVGNDAKLGSVLSGGPLSLLDRSHLFGFARYAGALMQGNQVLVDGGLAQIAALDGPDLSAYERAFPPPAGGNVALEPDQQQTLQPGSYGTASVKSRATLKLSSGDYYFVALDVLEPQARLELTQTVRVYVRDRLTFRGEVAVAGSPAFPELFLVYQGTAPARLESRYRGVVVATSAPIVLGTTSQPHEGGFFGREVEVQAGAAVRHIPFVLGP